MRRGPKPAKPKEAKPPAARKSPKDDGARVRDLEKRLAEALEREAGASTREAEALGKLQTRDRDLTEALEQQTATAEVLELIASSPGDLQPTFDGIVQRARQLCDGLFSVLYGVHGELVTVEADDHITPENRRLMRSRFPMAVNRNAIGRRVFLEHRVVHVEDAAADPHFQRIPFRQAVGYRSFLLVPMLREGAAIGAIGVGRVEPGGFTDKQVRLLQTFADQAVIAIENVRLFNELEARNGDLTESLARQTATSEVLRVISQSPTDLQPVFDTIAENARRLLRGWGALVVRFDGELLHVAGLRAGPGASEERIRERFPQPVSQDTFSGVVVHDRAVKQIADVETDDDWISLREHARRQGWRANLGVPMLHDGQPIGTITVTRREPGAFSAQEVDLLKTFADQAVIAIENVRLFNETKEALEQQTATAEVLRVISSSPTDVQPVFDAIARSAAALCHATISGVFRYDGELVHFVAANFATPEAWEAAKRAFPTRPSADILAIRAIAEGRIVHLPDVLDEPGTKIFQGPLGHRNLLSVPMMRDGTPLGAINVARTEVGAFSDSEITLLKTFADQAVIAIENVRLFTELQEKNQALTQAHAKVSEALEQQTATAEILRVISQSQTELQPVFEAIIDHAMQLFKAWAASVLLVDGQLIRLIAMRGGLPGSEQQLREQSPWPMHTPSPVTFCIANRTVVHIPDIEADHTIDEGIRALGRTRGWRSILAAPIVREGQPIGAISIQRAEAGAFSSAEIELLKTFTDQAAIAVENTRLLGELRARTSQLTRSVEELTALSEISRALSSTLDLDVVLQTVVTRASQLAGTDACSVFEYDEATEAFHLRATDNLDEEVVALARRTPTRKGEGVQGRMAVTRQPVQVPDIAAEDAYHGPLRDILLRTGTRAVLAIPMLREDQLIGGLTVNKKTPGEFSPEVIELLTTFATQSALAIQNARLFREIADKSRQLEVASQHKSEFLANMSHELRTPLNAIIGFSEVLSERMFGELNEKQEEYLKDIYASGTHLLSLINDILDLSKIEAGRMELELTEFDLPTAIENALMLVRERAGRRSIALHTNIDNRLGQIQADERKVRQVVLNLLSNAIKFTPEGGRIDVGAVPKDGSVEVSVSDTGIGIAPEDQEKVFEEFRQVGTAAKKTEGTGLGLTLCRKFVELHGGRIWVNSQVGMGSTFTFTIPVRHGE